MEPSIALGSLSIQAPVTAATNLLLSVQCAFYWRRLRTGRPDRAGCWSLFFLFMAGATLAGAPKHGLKHLLAGDAYYAVEWVVGVSTAAAVLFAQLAALAANARVAAPSGSANRRAVEVVRGLCYAQATLFVVLGLAVGPEMALVIANTAVGLGPVIVAEALRRRGSQGGGSIAGGLSLSLLTGAVYIGELSLGAWFNHIDLAHVMMGVSFFLIARGAACGASFRAGVPRGLEPRAPRSGSLGVPARGRA